ncbi:MAG: hypothetical protein QOH30_116, partial [Baekduia sp.]|nr:hypothetical protein [Baekduia sp.]
SGATGGSAVINNTPPGTTGTAAPGPAPGYNAAPGLGSIPSVIIKSPTTGYGGASVCG